MFPVNSKLEKDWRLDIFPSHLKIRPEGREGRNRVGLIRLDRQQGSAS